MMKKTTKKKKKKKKERSEGPNRNRDRLDGKWH